MKIVSLLYTNACNDNRVFKMTRTLANHGHEPVIVGFLSDNLPESEVVNGIQLNRLKLRTRKLRKNKLFEAFKYIEFACKTVRRYRKADVWHCNDLEAYLVGIFAKLFRPRLVLVYDAHELESERNNLRKWVKRMFFTTEKLFTRYAHTVITVSPSIQMFYRRHFKMKRDVLIYNTPHLVDFPKTNVLRKELNIGDDKMVFLFLGLLRPGRAIAELLDIFENLDQKYHMVFMGNGVLTEEIKKYAERSPNIHYKEAVPYNRILEYASGADFGFQSIEPVCLNNVYSMPNKLFEYIHAGVPVICNNLKDTKDLVESKGIGFGLDEVTRASFTSLLSKITPAEIAKMKLNIQRVKMEYNWEKEEQKLMDIYNQIDEIVRKRKK